MESRGAEPGGGRGSRRGAGGEAAQQEEDLQETAAAWEYHAATASSDSCHSMVVVSTEEASVSFPGSSSMSSPEETTVLYVLDQTHHSDTTPSVGMPSSPLPDQIIEYETTNKHDHPPEFYVSLEKDVKEYLERSDPNSSPESSSNSCCHVLVTFNAEIHQPPDAEQARAEKTQSSPTVSGRHKIVTTNAEVYRNPSTPHPPSDAESAHADKTQDSTLNSGRTNAEIHRASSTLHQHSDAEPAHAKKTPISDKDHDASPELPRTHMWRSSTESYHTARSAQRQQRDIEITEPDFQNIEADTRIDDRVSNFNDFGDISSEEPIDLSIHRSEEQNKLNTENGDTNIEAVVSNTKGRESNIVTTNTETYGHINIQTNNNSNSIINVHVFGRSRTPVGSNTNRDKCSKATQTKRVSNEINDGQIRNAEVPRNDDEIVISNSEANRKRKSAGTKGTQAKKSRKEGATQN